MTSGQLWGLISFISPFTLLIGVFIGLFFYKYLNKISRLLLLFLGMNLAVELLFRYFGYYSSLRYNLFLIPIFALFEIAFYSVLYYKHILRSKSNILITFSIVSFLLALVSLCFYKTLFQQKTFHSFGKVVADLTVIVFCITYYWRLLTGKIKQVKEVSQLNATFLIYYSVNLILFLPINFLVNASINIVFLFWVINLVSLVLFYLVLTYMIWRNGKTQKCLQ